MNFTISHTYESSTLLLVRSHASTVAARGQKQVLVWTGPHAIHLSIVEKHLNFGDMERLARPKGRLRAIDNLQIQRAFSESCLLPSWNLPIFWGKALQDSEKFATICISISLRICHVHHHRKPLLLCRDLIHLPIIDKPLHSFIETWICHHWELGANSHLHWT